MRAVCVALVAFGVVACGFAVVTQTQSEKSALVSYKTQGTEVREVLRQLFRQAKVSKYSIDPDVQGKVQFSASNVQLDVALASLLTQVGATFSAENNEYRVFTKQQAENPAPEAPGYEAKRGSFNFSGEDIETVIGTIFSQFDQSFVMSSKIQGKVTLTFNYVTLPVALDRLGRACGFTYELKDTVYTLLPAQTNAQTGTEILLPISTERMAPIRATDEIGIEKLAVAKVGQFPALTFTDRRASDLFSETFGQMKLKVKIMPGLQQKLSGYFNAGSFESRLYELKTLANAKVTLEKGVHVVRPR
jgi:type II secretory pathway component GspD/PulD (secretin)